jgi:CubicO group peptidase (beta-lactamase class C family)
MSHTGGISVSGFLGYPAGDPVPTLLQTLQGVPPANNDPVRVIYKPGSENKYSGGGMEILQLMTEDVTGVPFRSHVKDSLLTPLGMTRSYYVQPLSGPLAANAAKGHDADGVALPGGWNTYPELIAAGLWTTPSDLCRLIIEIQKAAAGSGAVLTKETAEKILTQQANSSFGLGFVVQNGNGGRMFSHSGSNLGFKTFFIGYRDRGQGVAIMTNGENGLLLFKEICRSVARVYGWPDNQTSEEAALVAVPLSVLQSYVGNYRQAGGDQIGFEIYLSGSDLMIKYIGVSSGRLDTYPISRDKFLVRGDLSGTIAFTIDGSGNVSGFTIAEMGLTANWI